VHERRLARSRCAHDRDERAGRDIERHTLKGVDGRFTLAVAAGDVGCADDCSV
jgi:hypothetical protein